MTAATLRTLLTAAGVMLASALAQAPLCTDEPQRSDSADYLRAVRGGALNTYLDSNSVTLPRFVSVIRDRSATEGHPWEYLRRREDAGALRHFHVPLGFYANALAARYAASDRTQRVLAAAAGTLICGLIVVLMRRLGAGVVLSGATAVAVAVNPQFVAAMCAPSPHPWFILVAVLFLERYEAFLETGNQRLLFFSAALLAIASATLELTPALVLAAVPATFIARPEWLRLVFRPRLWWRHLAAACAVFLLTLFLVWPGGILRGGYLVSYGVFAAQALFKRGELFPPLTLAGMYQRLFDSSAFLVVVCAAGMVLLGGLIWRRRAPATACLFGLYALVSFGLNAGNGFVNSTYAAEVIVFLLLTAGLGIHYAIGSATPRYRPVAAIAGCLVVGLCAAQELRNGPVRTTPADALATAVKRVPSLVPRGATVLVNRNPQTFAAYLPQYRIEQTEAESSLRPQSARFAGTPDYVLLDLGPINAKILGSLREHYYEVARFKSNRGAGDLVLWCRW